MNAEQVGIRRAVSSDTDELELVRGCARDQAAGLWPQSVSMKERIALEGVFTYLAEDEEIFGFVSVGAASDLFDSSYGEVLEWYLLPRRWRTGLGRKMMVHGLSVLKRRQYDFATIWLPPDAVPAISVIDALGFEYAEMEREDNVEDGICLQKAYVKDLADYF